MKRKKVIFLFKNISVGSKQNFHKLILLLKVVEHEEISIISGFCTNLFKNMGFLQSSVLVLLKSSICLITMECARKITHFLPFPCPLE